MTKQRTKSNTKRKPLSKNLRFEVFKRDYFTCQYCGRKAPEVVLHVDHITPIADGGTNDIMNLVTSCQDCNLGKGATKLSDNSRVVKQRNQAELLAARLEQIEMLRDWYAELANQDRAEIEAVNTFVINLTNEQYELSEHYKTEELPKILKKFGLCIVLDALRDGYANYGNLPDTLKKLSGICACKADPDTSLRVWIQSIMRKKFSNYKETDGKYIISAGYRVAGRRYLEALKDLVYDLPYGPWYCRKDDLYKFLNHVLDAEDN